MTFALLASLAAALMGFSCWASNLWPGSGTILRGAVARVLWWGVPFTAIVWLNGAPLHDAVILGVAAWAGAWVPHSEFPSYQDHWPSMLADLIVIVMRCAAVLAPPAGIFWLCGAYWPAMLWASFGMLPCMYLSAVMPHRWAGFCNEKQVSGVLFGMTTGVFLAVAIWTPTPALDLLP